MNRSVYRRHLVNMLAAILPGLSSSLMAASLSLVPSAGNLNVGDEVTVSVIADSEGADLVVADVFVDYDPAIFELLAIDSTQSDFQYNFALTDPTLFPVTEIDNGAGSSRVLVAVPSPGISGGSLQVASFLFRALGAGVDVDVSLGYSGPGALEDSNLIVDDGVGSDGLSQVANAAFTVVEAMDTDGDGIVDNEDNCIEDANADQRDSNGDGYGNRCDADLNNDGYVTATDYLILRSRLNTADADADLNGDGVVTATDYLILRSQLNQPPGPSGVVE